MGFGTSAIAAGGPAGGGGGGGGGSTAAAMISVTNPSQTLGANNTWIDVDFDTVVEDGISGAIDLGTNAERITVPSGSNGKFWVVSIQWYSDNLAAGLAFSLAHYNSSDVSQEWVGSPNVPTDMANFGEQQFVCQTYKVATGDYFLCKLGHNAGGDVASIGAATMRAVELP